MVTVKIDSYSVVVSGHAGYSKGGQDIVYAGISALTHTLGIALEKHGGLNNFSYQEDSGLAVMIWSGERQRRQSSSSARTRMARRDRAGIPDVAQR